MTGAFHEGLREAMGLPAVGTPPSDVALLRDYRSSEHRVLVESGLLFETPAEDIRNALQIMQLYDGSALDAEVRKDVEARLQAALVKLDRIDEFTQNPIRFVLRVAQMERALSELRKQFDESTLGAYVSEAGR